MYEEMISAVKQSEKEKDNYTVTSPVTGSIEQFNGIYKGSHYHKTFALRLALSKNGRLSKPCVIRSKLKVRNHEKEY
jgi:hypothetical protein